MAFDVHYSRNPFTDALLALFAGRSQAQRQNQLAESQMDFSASQQSARGLGQGLQQLSSYLYNRDLQGRQMAGQSALEQLRQNAVNQRQQAALDQQQEFHYGGDPDALMQMYPQARTPAEAADLNRVDRFYARVGYANAPGAGTPPIAPGGGAPTMGGPMVGPPAPDASMQQFQQLMDGTMKQMGLEEAYQGHTITEIGQIQTGLLKSMNDKSLLPWQKQQAIDTATEALMMAAVPTVGPRTSPITFPELAQQGRMIMPPGFSNVLAFDDKGAPKVLTMHPLEPDLTTPEMRDKSFASTTREDKYGVWAWNKKAQAWDLKAKSDHGINWATEYSRAEKEIMDYNNQLLQGSYFGRADPSVNKNWIEPSDENIRKWAMENIHGRQKLQGDFVGEQEQGKIQIAQDKLNSGMWPDNDEWVKDAIYTIYDPNGNAIRAKVVGFQNGEPLIEPLN